MGAASAAPRISQTSNRPTLPLPGASTTTRTKSAGVFTGAPQSA
jgi:hypothetical protein